MSRKRWIWVGVLAAAVLLIGVGAWAAQGPIGYAKMATGFGAKQMCSCLRISGRPLDSCMADFPADARNAVTITEDGEVVRASVLFGAISSEAVYEEEFGCRILD